jgi:hypothetical protein
MRFFPAASGLGLTAALAVLGAAGPAAAAERVQVTGELVDTWCAVSGIMYAYGTAHHQCAVWCAVGGIPVSLKAEDGGFYMVLKIEGDAVNVANPKLVTIQGHRVTVDGELHARDGVNYLLVDQVATDEGIVNLTHAEYGIVPFGE